MGDEKNKVDELAKRHAELLHEVEQLRARRKKLTQRFEVLREWADCVTCALNTYRTRGVTGNPFQEKCAFNELVSIIESKPNG